MVTAFQFTTTSRSQRSQGKETVPSKASAIQHQHRSNDINAHHEIIPINPCFPQQHNFFTASLILGTFALSHQRTLFLSNKFLLSHGFARFFSEVKFFSKERIETLSESSIDHRDHVDSS
jgi:hypothetical protein